MCVLPCVIYGMYFGDKFDAPLPERLGSSMLAGGDALGTTHVGHLHNIFFDIDLGTCLAPALDEPRHNFSVSDHILQAPGPEHFGVKYGCTGHHDQPGHVGHSLLSCTSPPRKSEICLHGRGGRSPGPPYSNILSFGFPSFAFGRPACSQGAGCPPQPAPKTK